MSLVIEDDDGFRTEWPWPEDRLLIANADFVALCEAQHDALRTVHTTQAAGTQNRAVTEAVEAKGEQQ